MITTKQLRNKFINYFKSKEHSHQQSASLIPFGDDTLLFTNAGMIPFKDIFLGTEKANFTRGNKQMSKTSKQRWKKAKK